MRGFGVDCLLQPGILLLGGSRDAEYARRLLEAAGIGDDETGF